MKIVIVGPGAIGCLLAAFFSKSKDELWLLDKSKERAAKIGRQGISVEGIGSSSLQVKVKITCQAQEIGSDVDLIVMCVKSYDLKEALLKVKPLIGRGTSVLSLQNGIGNIETISDEIGSDKVIGGVTGLGSTMLGIGQVRFAGKGETLIGRVDGTTPVEMRAIRELFNKAGLDLKLSRDIKGILWSKLIVNAGINALSALTRLPNGKLVEFEGTRRLMREAVTEAVKVAKRKRIKLIYDDPLAKVESVCLATAGNVSSMLQDVLNKKRTEIDFINGAIVRFGQELGITVPVNTLLVELIKTMESSYSQQVF